MRRLLLLLACILPSAAVAAEFELDGPGLELRQVQFCGGCKAALVVTTVPAGCAVQCPRCQSRQARLPSRQLLVRLFQVCPRCGARLDVRDRKGGTLVRCGSCKTTQAVLPEAGERRESGQEGTGFPPEAQTITPVEPLVPAAPPPDPKPEVRPTQPQIEESPAPAPAAPPELPSVGAVPPAEPPAVPPAAPIAVPTDSTASTEPAPVPSTAIEAEAVLLAPPPGMANLDDEEPAIPLAPEELGGEAPAPARPVVEPDAGETDPSVAARVNGTPLYTADLESPVAVAMEKVRLELGRASATPAGAAMLRKREKELRVAVLEERIDRELLRQAARDEGIEPEREAVLTRAEILRREAGPGADARLLLEAAEEELIAEILARRLVPAPPAPAEIRARYEARRGQLLQPRRVALRSIVIWLDRAGRKDPRPAGAIAREAADLLRGGRDFRELVFRFSEEPGAEKGGVVLANGDPHLPEALLSEPVRALLPRMRPGQAAGPVRLPGAVAFFRLEEIREPAPLPFEEVQESLEAELAREQRRDALRRRLRELRSGAKIEVCRLP